MNRCRRAIALLLIFSLIALTEACGDDTSSQGQPGNGGGTPAPAPQVSRLAWSQAAPSLAAAQGYSFILFVDGARTTLSETTCSGSSTPTTFECSGPLPALSPGRRALEISARDQGTGLESPRSGPLAVDVGTDGRPRALLGDGPVTEPVHAARPVLSPSTACASETPTECFAVTVIASDVAPVRRLLPLPDGRLLMLTGSGAVTTLPSGTSERPEFGSSSAGQVVEVADVAADPDFGVNRFLYFATTAIAPDGRRTIGVVRVRELADRVGEPATIVADLPAAPGGYPAISIGPDRRIYLAMPGTAEDRTGYGGHILRFTREGRAAGNDRNGSPILARGRPQPMRLAWDSASRLLIASAESGSAPALAVVPLDSVQWPTAYISVAGTIAASPNAGLSDLATAPAGGGTADVATLARTGDNPQVLRLARVTVGNHPEIVAARAIPLGSLVPTAIAFASGGELVVAAQHGEGPGAILLRLRRISPAARLPR